jgi:DNA-binding NtrC family response regulator
MTSTSEKIAEPERVLIEDDEDTFRAIMGFMLTSAGYECVAAETPTKALEILHSEEIKFIDLVCCGVTHWADVTFNRLVGTTASRTIPVIVCSATCDISLKVKALGMGCYDFLLRPFQREELVFAVRRALQYRRVKLENLYLRDRMGLGSRIEIPPNLIIRR